MAASVPSSNDPVAKATAKPVTAPTTIIPSTPRLSTPERSTTSSPSAARSSGVDAVMMVRMTFSSILFSRHSRSLRRRHEADAVKDQGVAGENKEQQDALEYPRHLVGDAERNLRRFAA